MDITITPGTLHGTLAAIPSKSQAHRILICAAFSDKPSQILCPQTNRDIDATADCLKALGADIQRNADGFFVAPIKKAPHKAVLKCGESGSTLRFMLPIVGALGVHTTFLLEGRLPQRPLSPLWEEMERMGCRLCYTSPCALSCSGQLRPGTYALDGGISSQFITGLLFACSLLNGHSKILISGKLESKPYVDMTQQVMLLFGVRSDNLEFFGNQVYSAPDRIMVEGDWSNAAFYLAAKAMGSQVNVAGLNPQSLQGDKVVLQLLRQFGQRITIDAADIPDLIPILSVVAAANCGAVFTNIRRLRLKESDRVASVIRMLQALGCEASADENTMVVHPGVFKGGCVDAWGDHRIAMAAAIAATAAEGPVTICGAECVSKSYPHFWEEYKRLGGNYEQHLR